MASNRFFPFFLKVIALVLVLQTAQCVLPTETHAQTWNEWFKQKKTQRKYLIKQIALLKIYLGYVKEGYQIAQKGLTTISNIKDGNFNLHRDFFSSLNKVNPHIANAAKVADIIAFQLYIVRNIREVNNFCRNNEHFTPEEVRYVAAIYTNMLFLTDPSVSELLIIIRSDQTKMKDDERLMRIDKIYDDMLDQHAFVQSFDGEVRLIAAERERQEREVESLQKQYDIL